MSPAERKQRRVEDRIAAMGTLQALLAASIIIALLWGAWRAAAV